MTDFKAYKPFFNWSNTEGYQPTYGGNYWDGDYNLVPIYATTQHDQQPDNAQIQVILRMCDTRPPIRPEFLQQLKDHRVDGEICQLAKSDEKSLQRFFPGIRPSLCRVVWVEHVVPLIKHDENSQWRFTVGTCAIGIFLLAFSHFGKLRRRQHGHASEDGTPTPW